MDKIVWWPPGDKPDRSRLLNRDQYGFPLNDLVEISQSKTDWIDPGKSYLTSLLVDKPERFRMLSPVRYDTPVHRLVNYAFYVSLSTASQSGYHCFYIVPRSLFVSTIALRGGVRTGKLLNPFTSV